MDRCDWLSWQVEAHLQTTAGGASRSGAQRWRSSASLRCVLKNLSPQRENRMLEGGRTETEEPTGPGRTHPQAHARRLRINKHAHVDAVMTHKPTHEERNMLLNRLHYPQSLRRTNRTLSRWSSVKNRDAPHLDLQPDTSICRSSRRTQNSFQNSQRGGTLASLASLEFN